MIELFVCLQVGVFGEGIYLLGELFVFFYYSFMGRSWERSSLGDKFSCVVVCEMIDDFLVKCQVKNSKFIKGYSYRKY